MTEQGTLSCKRRGRDEQWRLTSSRAHRAAITSTTVGARMEQDLCATMLAWTRLPKDAREEQKRGLAEHGERVKAFMNEAACAVKRADRHSASCPRPGRARRSHRSSRAQRRVGARSSSDDPGGGDGESEPPGYGCSTFLRRSTGLHDVARLSSLAVSR
jgi:hypothetical protein